ncbi:MULTISPECIES: hypothetical protein [Brevibacterium]|nr:hypothetical protein [Brevibacterium sp.]
MFQTNAAEIVLLLLAALVLAGCLALAAMGLLWLRRTGRVLAQEAAERTEREAKAAGLETEAAGLRAEELRARTAAQQAARALREVQAREAEARVRRTEAEVVREQAEASRVEMETRRVEAQVRQAEAETSRAEAEASRAEAETVRAQAGTEELRRPAGGVVGAGSGGASGRSGSGGGLSPHAAFDAASLQRMARELGADVSLVKRVADTFGDRGLTGLYDLTQRWVPGRGEQRRRSREDRDAEDHGTEERGADGRGDAADEVSPSASPSGWHPGEVAEGIERLLGRGMDSADLEDLKDWLGDWFDLGAVRRRLGDAAGQDDADEQSPRPGKDDRRGPDGGAGPGEDGGAPDDPASGEDAADGRAEADRSAADGDAGPECSGAGADADDQVRAVEEDGGPAAPELDASPAPTGGIDVRALIEEALRERRRGTESADADDEGDPASGDAD